MWNVRADRLTRGLIPIMFLIVFGSARSHCTASFPLADCSKPIGSTENTVCARQAVIQSPLVLHIGVHLSCAVIGPTIATYSDFNHLVFDIRDLNKNSKLMLQTPSAWSRVDRTSTPTMLFESVYQRIEHNFI